jgi:hypothetical protein
MDPSGAFRLTLPPPADELGQAVLRNLLRPPISGAWWRLGKAAAAGALSLGIAPLLVLPRRFAMSARIESDQAWYAEQWLRLSKISPADPVPLGDFPPHDMTVPVLCTIARGIGAVLAIAAVAMLLKYRTGGAWLLISGTWGLWWTKSAGEPSAARLYVVWTALLTVAYACHWQAVRLHMQRTRRTVAQLNALLPRADLRVIDDVQPPGRQMTLWLALGVILAAAGAAWAVPMMVASAAQSGYILHTRRAVRRQLADRMRRAIASSSPRARISVPESLRQVCRSRQCTALLPAAALFCPRCGDAVPEVIGSAIA